MNRTFALALCATALPLMAQNTATRQEIAKHWKNIREATLAAADAVAPSDYAYRPGPGDVSFAERLTKIALDNGATFAAIAGTPSPVASPDNLDKDTVTKLLATSFDFGAKTIDGLKDSDLDRVIGSDTVRDQIMTASLNTAHQLGLLEAYPKMQAIKPPPDRNRYFMFYGYGAAWLIVCLYVIAVSLRERRLRAELDRVKHLLEDRPEHLRV